jgi:hypothetical protein
VPKLNQGARQRLYIVAGVLFPARTERYVRAGLALSFAQAKESA